MSDTLVNIAIVLGFGWMATIVLMLCRVFWRWLVVKIGWSR